jgi:predicted oxidoreductase
MESLGSSCREYSLRRLRLDQIDPYQLHRIDRKLPAEEQLGTLKDLQAQGKIKQIGLSEVIVCLFKARSVHLHMGRNMDGFDISQLAQILLLTPDGKLHGSARISPPRVRVPYIGRENSMKRRAASGSGQITWAAGARKEL